MEGLERTEIKENPGENETKDVNLEMISPNYDNVFHLTFIMNCIVTFKYQLTYNSLIL